MVKKAETPKAVLVFRSMASRFPARSWWPTIVQEIGEEQANLDFWGLVVFHYVGHGYNPCNVDNMLKMYRDGVVPGHPELGRRAVPGPISVEAKKAAEPVSIVIEQKARGR
jgi:hypothetical protein